MFKWRFSYLKQPEKETQTRYNEAEKKAQEIKNGANEYADYILANIQLMVTKMQKNMIGIEKNLVNGRALIEESKQEKKETNNEPDQRKRDSNQTGELFETR